MYFLCYYLHYWQWQLSIDKKIILADDKVAYTSYGSVQQKYVKPEGCRKYRIIKNTCQARSRK